MSATSTIVVVEPHASGHRAQHVRWICQALAGAGHRMVVATSTAALLDPVIIRTVNEGLATTVSIPMPQWSMTREHSAIAMFRGDVRYWLLLRQLFTLALKRYNLTAAVLPYVDYCFFSMALLGSPFGRVPWVGITMRTAPAGVGVRQRLRRLALRRILRQSGLRALYSNDPRTVPTTGNRVPGIFAYLADPVEPAPAGDRHKLRGRLGIPEAMHVVLAFGSLDLRKGIAELLQAVDALPAEIPVAALLAGEQQPGVRELLDGFVAHRLERHGRLLQIPGRINDADVPDILAAADSAWVAYATHDHMSGVLVLAAAAGLPLVVTKYGAIAHVASGLTLTHAVDPTDGAAVQATLRLLATGPRMRRDSLECARICSEYSLDAFRTRLVESIG